MAGTIAKDKAVIAVQEIALETVIGHLRDVAKLHRPVTEDMYAWDCTQGNCDHDDECPEEPFTYCAGCHAVAQVYDDEAAVCAWPCDTVKALGGAELASKLTEAVNA